MGASLSAIWPRVTSCQDSPGQTSAELLWDGLSDLGQTLPYTGIRTNARRQRRRILSPLSQCCQELGLHLGHRCHALCFVLIFMISLSNRVKNQRSVVFLCFGYFFLFVGHSFFFLACVSWQSWLQCVPAAVVPAAPASQARWE